MASYRKPAPAWRVWSLYKLLALVLAGCAAPAPTPAARHAATTAEQATASLPEAEAFAAPPPSAAEAFRFLNRLSWGATAAEVQDYASTPVGDYLRVQLRPGEDRLPAPVQAQIDALTLSRRPMVELVQSLEQQRRAADAITNDDEKNAARQSYQQELTRLGREAATRHLLRALASRNQVQQRMTWFWLNHFNVYQFKSNLRAMVGDFDDVAIRPHAMGRFRDLLGAVSYHPAMLRYLDNEQNASGRLNENFARELMELHTLGADGGYSQGDVQQLARVLSGVGVNLQPGNPTIGRELQAHYVRRGLFEFNPQRHDFGAKQLLGQPLQSRGLAEVDEALDRLARHPATARFISRKLAQFWLSDRPDEALVARMAQTFLLSDGDIAQTLATLFATPAFAQRSGAKFKDPMHYVLSSVRMAYGSDSVVQVAPLLNWLNRLGQPLYGRQTPDGYPMDQSGWDSPGQMAARFEVARAIASANATLLGAAAALPRIDLAQSAGSPYQQAIVSALGAATRNALAQATSVQERNSFLLASPEMMLR
ncbi:MAG: DUF1800 domain-containing protein [Betaproteobacteria bacterium]|nr:DUF1800 domain-containing protein [Betaproteobacteria bacterium]